MTAPLPTSLPPLELQDRAVKALLSRLSITEPDISHLKLILAITARQALSGEPTVDLRPLQALRNVSLIPQDFAPEILLNTIISYPTNLIPVSSFIDSLVAQCPGVTESIRTEIIPDLVTRLRLSSSPSTLSAAAKILLGLTRSHEELFGVVLTEADYILPALKDAYPKLGRDKAGLRGKSDMLLLCHSLIKVMGEGGGGGREALKRLMDDQAGSSKRVLVDGGLRGDYEAVFERMSGLGDAEIAELRRIRDEEARMDPVSGHACETGLPITIEFRLTKALGNAVEPLSELTSLVTRPGAQSPFFRTHDELYTRRSVSASPRRHPLRRPDLA